MRQELNLISPITIAPEDFNALYELTHEVVDNIILESAMRTTHAGKEYHVIGYDKALKLRDTVRSIVSKAQDEPTVIHG